jgi:hypothetical protein
MLPHKFNRSRSFLFLYNLRCHIAVGSVEFWSQGNISACQMRDNEQNVSNAGIQTILQSLIQK